MWTAPAGASPVVIAAGSADEQDQHDDQENQHHVTSDNKARPNLLVRHPMGGNVDDVRLVLRQRRIGARGVCF